MKIQIDIEEKTLLKEKIIKAEQDFHTSGYAKLKRKEFKLYPGSVSRYIQNTKLEDIPYRGQLY